MKKYLSVLVVIIFCSVSSKVVANDNVNSNVEHVKKIVRPSIDKNDTELACIIITVHCVCRSITAQWCDCCFHPDLNDYANDLCRQACGEEPEEDPSSGGDGN